MSATDVRSYRDLIAWQKGMDLVSATYRETSHLPDAERYGLMSQMRRSAVAVPSNIAEGWGRHAGSEYLHFLRISRGSIFELSTQAEICKRLHFAGDWDAVLLACEEIGRILNGLIGAVRRARDDSAAIESTQEMLVLTPGP